MPPATGAVPALQWISTAATLFAMLVAQYLIMRHYLGIALVEEGLPNQLPLFLPIGLIAALLKEGLGAAPMTLFFWVIAMWEGYSLPRARSLRRILPQTPPHRKWPGRNKEVCSCQIKESLLISTGTLTPRGAGRAGGRDHRRGGRDRVRGGPAR